MADDYKLMRELPMRSFILRSIAMNNTSEQMLYRRKPDYQIQGSESQFRVKRMHVDPGLLESTASVEWEVTGEKKSKLREMVE